MDNVKNYLRFTLCLLLIMSIEILITYYLFNYAFIINYIICSTFNLVAYSIYLIINGRDGKVSPKHQNVS